MVGEGGAIGDGRGKPIPKTKLLRYPSAFRGEPPLPYANFILIKAKMGKPDREISVSVGLP